MLNNLRAELVRKGLDPEKAVETVLGCNPKTAKSKTHGITDFSVPEAVKVANAYFEHDNFDFLYLFEKADSQNGNVPIGQRN